jgi:hypothetical protein
MPLMPARCFRFPASLFVLLVFVTSGRATLGQLDAPTAFSDFAGCKHHTCTWVPWDTHKTFKHGEFAYTVDNFKENDDGGDFVLRRGGKELLRTPLKDLSASVSVVWSPDSRSFAVTWSNGGASGWFDVRVFQIRGDSVVELPAIHDAFENFKARHWCRSRGDNRQAYRWASDSQELVLVLSVYPAGDCGEEMGHTEGLVVNASTGRIEQNWNLQRLKAYIQSHPEW